MEGSEKNHQHLYVMKVLTNVNTGWVQMGRTIALKLSKNEEQIVAQLNKQGMTNSELLRNALRQYFEYLHQATALNTNEKTMSFIQDNSSMMSRDSLSDLKNEIEEIQSFSKKTQEEMQKEIAKLHQMMSELCVDTKVIQKKPIPSRTEVLKDIHHEVDAFLEHQAKQGDMWKKRI